MGGMAIELVPPGTKPDPLDRLAAKVFAIPKSVSDVRSQIVGPMTKENIVACLETISSNDRKKLMAAIDYTAKDSVKKDYKNSKRTEKNEWLAQYILDPELTSNEGVNTTTVYTEETEMDDTVLITQEQMGGPLYLNSASMAKIVCESKELDEFPHEIESLAKAGIKQFKFSMKKFTMRSGKREEATVKQKIDLKSDELEAVRGHMKANFGQKAEKKRPAAKAQAADPQKKLKRDAHADRASSLRKLKNTLEKVAREAGAMSLKAMKVEQKMYPPQMKAWCDEQIDVLKTHASHAQLVYNELVIETVGEKEIDALKIDSRKADTSANTLEDAMGEWQKKVGKEIVKLAD